DRVFAACGETEMTRSAENSGSIRFVEARHAFAALYHDWRRTNLLQRDAAFFGDIHQPMNKHLVANGINLHAISSTGERVTLSPRSSGPASPHLREADKGYQ